MASLLGLDLGDLIDLPSDLQRGLEELADRAFDRTLHLAVTGLRGMASADGHIMAANPAGKAKALCQNVAIGALLFHYTTIGLPAHTVGMTLLAVASVLTFWSGYVYFADYLGWKIPRRPKADSDEPEASA